MKDTKDRYKEERKAAYDWKTLYAIPSSILCGATRTSCQPYCFSYDKYIRFNLTLFECSVPQDYDVSHEDQLHVSLFVCMSVVPFILCLINHFISDFHSINNALCLRC